MKTTIELPDELFFAAKQKALKMRKTLKWLVEQGLKEQLKVIPVKQSRKKKPFKWVTVKGGLITGIDIQSRESMHHWLAKQR